MTVKLELKPEVEESLVNQARAKGVPLEAYLNEVIEGLAHAQPAPTLEEFREALDRLAEMGSSLPNLPSAAFSRESIYQDHN
jgi:hypothetical protein